MNRRKINLLQPSKISFGLGCLSECVDDVTARGLKRVLILTIDPLLNQLDPFVDRLQQAGCAVQLDTSITVEPSIGMFETVLAAARAFEPDAVLGIGGGSSMDTAKLVAAAFGAVRHPGQHGQSGRAGGSHSPHGRSGHESNPAAQK